MAGRRACQNTKAGAWMLRYKALLITLLTPLVLLPLPLVVKNQMALTGYTLLVMAVYWSTECIPMAVTGMLPMFLLPMFGITKESDVVINYMKTSTAMFYGGMICALAIEKCNFHRRIALKLLGAIGTQPRWLMMGFMLCTWFLSMWISNTASTAMILPMMEAVLEQLEPGRLRQLEKDRLRRLAHQGRMEGVFTVEIRPHHNGIVPTMNAIQMEMIVSPEHNLHGSSDEMEHRDNLASDKLTTAADVQGIDGASGKAQVMTAAGDYDDEEETEEEKALMECEQREYTQLGKALTLGIAFSANIGGTGTLTGSPVNLVMKQFADDIWQKNGFASSPINFASWMVIGVPTSLILEVILWLWFQVFYLGCREACCCCCRKRGAVSDLEQKKEQQDQNIKSIIKEEYAKLGRLRFAEIMVMIIFVLLVLLWFFRDPEFLRGWARPFNQGYVGDAVPAVMLACLLFIIPSTIPKNCNFIGRTEPYDTLMDWKTVATKMPWGLFWLVGGGFALAEACTTSGLAPMIGEKLTVFARLPDWAMVMILVLIITILTNVTSNTAICTLMMPIIATMAEGIGKNPLYLMLPVAFAASYAFLMPVGTPPNAIAFSFGRISVPDMVKAGVILKVFATLVVTMATHTYGMAYFKLNTIPWGTNDTTVATFLQASDRSALSDMLEE